MSNWNKDMTVKEAFNKAFGINAEKVCVMKLDTETWAPHFKDGEKFYWVQPYGYHFALETVVRDISDLPAWVFAEIMAFGYEFNQAVKECP